MPGRIASKTEQKVLADERRGSIPTRLTPQDVERDRLAGGQDGASSVNMYGIALLAAFRAVRVSVYR